MEAKITCNNALCFTEKLQFERRIQELEVDLKLNASMLAKQTDLAREAETRVKELEEESKSKSLEIKALQMNLKAYGEMISNLQFRIKELEALSTTQDQMLDIASTRINKAEQRVGKLEEGIGQINELISNRENAVLLGPGWTIATIQNIIDKLLSAPAK